MATVSKLNSCSNANTAYITSNLTASNQPSVTWTGGNQTIGIGGTNSYGTGIYLDGLNGFSTLSTSGDLFKQFLNLIKEEDLTEIFDKIIAANKKEVYASIISGAVRARHFSEEFLIKYLDCLTLEDILVRHAENIYSQEYPTIYLTFSEKE